MSVFDDSGDCNGPAVSEARRKGHSKLYVKDGKIVSEAADRAARTSGPKGGRDNMKQLPESDSPKQGEDLLDFFQRRLEEGSPVMGKGQSDMIATVTSEPRYPALAELSEYHGQNDAYYRALWVRGIAELADAERKAQQFDTQRAEIERLRERIKELERKLELRP